MKESLLLLLEGGPIMTVAKESNLTAMEQKSKIIAPNDSSPIYLSEKNPKLNDVNGQSPWCHYYLCLCTHTCARASARVEGRVWESALSGPRDGSQPSWRLLHPQSHCQVRHGGIHLQLSAWQRRAELRVQLNPVSNTERVSRREHGCVQHYRIGYDSHIIKSVTFNSAHQEQPFIWGTTLEKKRKQSRTNRSWVVTGK